MERVILAAGKEISESGQRQLGRYRWVHAAEVDAVDQARRLRPDAVLLKFARAPAALALRLRRALPETAVIVIVERARAQEKRACLAAGAQFYGAPSPDIDGHAVIESSTRSAWESAHPHRLRLVREG